uniref:Uncharacterized protein n=1 Tax=Cyanoderma ruficeps TaxID=181631 RepID=A0A8C3R5H0_9PASS
TPNKGFWDWDGVKGFWGVPTHILGLVVPSATFWRFGEPNPEDPLNKEAAEVLQSNRRLFEQNVQRSLRGGYVGATYFERCLK